MTKLHVGCGERYLPGFIHVDIRKLPHVNVVTSADKLDMFKDNSIKLIYACHILDHFGRNEVEGVLQEWYRVLKQGGILRLAVSDFEVVAKIYCETKDLKLILGILFGRQDYEGNKHGTAFDYVNLSEILEKVGFGNIHKYDWKETIHKNYDDLSQAYIPHMDKENGTLISLNVEAEKIWSH